MTTHRSYRRFACLAAMLAAMTLISAAPLASAQTSQGGYAPPSSNVQAEIQSDPVSTPSNAPSAHKAANTVQRSGSQANGALPFTGLDLVFIGLAGVGLLAVGLGLRRLTLRGDRAEPRNAG